MRKILLIIVIFFSLQVNGQNLADTISIINNKFYQHDKELNMAQLETAVMHNIEAYKLVTQARNNMLFSTILAYPGGFLIGYPIGTAIAQGNPNWVLAGIGAGLLLIAIPVSISAQKKAVKAVNLYNGSIIKEKNKTKITLSCTQNGVGIVMKF